MRMQKGICIELHGDRSVYMLSNGRFATGKPQKGTAVGEEAYFVPSAGKSRIKRAMPILAAVAVLFIVISTFTLPAKEAYGYVQVESNPGIELGIDDEWRVISARELNEDGGQLIERLGEWENRSLEQVLQQALALSVDDDTEQVTITTVQSQDDAKTIDTVEQITLAALAANSDRQLQIHLKEANKEQWRQSKKQHVPVARFVEKDRTFTSPGKQNHDVQPAQDTKNRAEKATRQENQPNEPKDTPAAEPEGEEPEPADQKAIKKEPAPAAPEREKANEQKPSLPKAGNRNAPNPAPKQPETKEGAEKPDLSSEEKPNAGKGNNSGKPKSSGKPSENPGNPPPDKGSKNQGNGHSKEKGNHQETKGSKKNEPQEQEDGHKSNPGLSGSDNRKGAGHKEKSSAGTENGKNHKPNQGKPPKSSEP